MGAGRKRCTNSGVGGLHVQVGQLLTPCELGSTDLKDERGKASDYIDVLVFLHANKDTIIIIQNTVN